MRIYSKNYFIFADYVYGVEKVLGNHPGGWEIIEKIRGREVDRFIYGMEPLEVFDTVSRVSHSAKSIKLAGEPLAKLCIPCPFKGMRELNSAKIETISTHDAAKRIHTVYLSSLDEPFAYRGYTHLSQIGQYYAVTIDNKKTRLYTMVNFLQARNVELIKKVSNGRAAVASKNVETPDKGDTLESFIRMN